MEFFFAPNGLRFLPPLTSVKFLTLLSPISEEHKSAISSVLFAHEEGAHKVSLLGPFRLSDFSFKEPRHHVMLLRPDFFGFDKIHLALSHQIVDRPKIANVLVLHELFLYRRLAIRDILWDIIHVGQSVS